MLHCRHSVEFSRNEIWPNLGVFAQTSLLEKDQMEERASKRFLTLKDFNVKDIPAEFEQMYEDGDLEIGAVKKDGEISGGDESTLETVHDPAEPQDTSDLISKVFRHRLFISCKALSRHLRNSKYISLRILHESLGLENSIEDRFHPSMM
jgi:hypothetical protein